MKIKNSKLSVVEKLIKLTLMRVQNKKLGLTNCK